MRRPLARVREIVVERRQPDLERDRHVAGGAVHPGEGERARERLLVLVDRHVPLRRRHAEPGARDDVLVVLGDERRAVVAGAVGDLEDLLGLELRELEPGDARRVVAVDEQPAAVGYAAGLAELRMVGVVPRHEAVAGHQHGLRLLAVAPTVLRALREDRHVLEEPAGRQAVHPDLAVEPAGHEGVELVVFARGDVDPLGSVARLAEPRGIRRAAACGEDGAAGKQRERTGNAKGAARHRWSSCVWDWSLRRNLRGPGTADREPAVNLSSHPP